MKKIFIFIICFLFLLFFTTKIYANNRITLIGNIDFELIYNNINTNNIVNFEIQEISIYELVDYIVYSSLNTKK